MILARLLRAGPSPGPGTADAALRKAGMDPEVAAAPEERLSYARALVLLDRAFSLPLYARFSQR
ncbi:MAG TPA: hypothetical protein VNT75_04870 [Symbiobacteriaceae bacterium]|nr:hypothetical protein [Symbiobacteriaceae bacterium]